jgi:hypothetical protein
MAALMLLEAAAGGSAVVRLPFHCMASVTLVGGSFSKPPTMVQLVRVGQDTAGVEMSPAPGSSGVAWLLQVVPFQRWAMMIPPRGLNPNPAAVQSVGDAHERLESPGWPRLVFGVC